MVINMGNNKQIPKQEQKEIQSSKLELFNDQAGFSAAMVMHIVLIAAIVIIFIVCAYKIYKWNKGVPSDYDPDFVSTDFDVETLDSIIPLAPDKLKGHEDDGLTTILFLGNDPLSMPKGQDNGLAEMIAANAPDPDTIKVYNGSFTGSTISVAYENYNDGYWMDSFSLSNLAKAICSRDFSQTMTAAYYSYDPDFVPTVEMLENLDMNTVDILCIMYDAIDYIEERPSDDPNSPYSIVTYTGGLRKAITDIQEAYPFIRIVVMSHTFCFSINEEGNFQNGDRSDLGHGTISHYLQKELDVTGDCSVSWIDNFYGSINEDNYRDYMTDYIHFNDEGRKLLANRFIECILQTKSAD
ncbi:MAG: SGNH/GDSL hydrolase family protein [Lachnospiraceae bacterium]|nr:SGNH/GDSL hydrolase family protein [Lachnospiraceae bacterium]